MLTGGRVRNAVYISPSTSSLRLPTTSLDLICNYDIIEHTEDKLIVDVFMVGAHQEIGCNYRAINKSATRYTIAAEDLRHLSEDREDRDHCEWMNQICWEGDMVANPNNPLAHHMLLSPKYQGERIWVCQDERIYVSTDSSGNGPNNKHWVPIQVTSSCIEEMLHMLPELVRKECEYYLLAQKLQA